MAELPVPIVVLLSSPCLNPASKLTLEFAIESEENGQFVIRVHHQATALHIGAVVIPLRQIVGIIILLMVWEG
jgi:hypothetical protein